jgi:hypothetical protein
MLFFSYVALHRFVDVDEGFYLIASRLVLLHRTPYLDFFYTQAPLLPYAYAGWLKLFGLSWTSARLFSAFLTTMIGLLIFEHVCRETRRWAAGLSAIMLYASATYIFAWFPAVKTFSLATLLFFGAYVLLVRQSSTSSSKWLLPASGVLLGLSVDTRSYLVALTPLLLWWILKNSVSGPITRIVHFIGGMLLGLLPSLWLLAASPSRFLFSNLGYHSMRSDAGLIGGWYKKLVVIGMVFAGPRETGLQFTIVALTSFILIFLMGMRRKSSILAFLIAFAVGVISILPTPPFTQYFCICMPFLIVAAVCAASDYLRTLQGGSLRGTALIFGELIILFLGLSVSGFRSYLITGEEIMAGLGKSVDAQNWSLARVRAVSKAIDDLSWPNEQVASFWPGYIFQTNALPYPGFENDFGIRVSEQLTAEQRARYHIISPSEISSYFAAHGPRIVVVGNQFYSSGHLPLVTALLDRDGYRVVESVGDTSVYLWGSGP